MLNLFCVVVSLLFWAALCAFAFALFPLMLFCEWAGPREYRKLFSEIWALFRLPFVWRK